MDINHCYLRLEYPYFYENTMQAHPEVDIADFQGRLRVFLESTYYEHAHGFQIKLCFLHAAFKRACTSQILFLVGSGDGKGMEAVLDRALFGESGSSTLDCGVFLDRSEFCRRTCVEQVNYPYPGDGSPRQMHR